MDPKAMNKGPEKRLRLDDLGWLASSTSQPRKRQEVEGVSATTILELQAQLYKTQEHVRLRQSGGTDDKHLPRTGGSGFNIASLLDKRNAGVASRDQRDRLEIKTAAEKAADSYAALERKAMLYDKLARGDVDDDDERYEVDFLQKGSWRDGGRGRDDDAGRRGDEEGREEQDYFAVDTVGLAVGGSGAMMTADMSRERERRDWEAAEMQRLDEEQAADEKRRQRREAIHDMAQETRESRERAVAQREAKEASAQQKQARLKEAFLKKQLQKLAAAKAAGT